MPTQRSLTYTGHLWARIAAVQPDVTGRVEVGLRRRIGRAGSPAGDVLAAQQVLLGGCEWDKQPFQLELADDTVARGEPVDFFLRWLPGARSPADLLIDSAFLFPADAVQGLDPEVVALVKAWPVPLLRWPGGNFVSQYHWRDGVGPLDRRPTRPNLAWYGLEYNVFGTREFIHFCRLIGAEPQISVNTATGTPEEAADWVEFCNGAAATRMGRLRAEQGDVEPYGVRLWEVGNEPYGIWQTAYHGAEENARRFAEFASAMRAVDSSIELIATGNGFDFATPGPGYDHTHADQRWHQKLIEMAGHDLNYISLHCLPVNDQFMERLTNDQAYYSLMAQPATWERRLLPDLLRQCDQALSLRSPVRLALTEWGIAGMRRDRPYLDTYAEALYAGLVLNLMIRNAERIPIANATALLHGSCIRKAAGEVYIDPQYHVIQMYAKLIGAQPLPCCLEAPGFDVSTGTDVSGPEADVPFVDAVVCWSQNGDPGQSGLHLAVVNFQLSRSVLLHFALPSLPFDRKGSQTALACSDPLARSTLVAPHRFPLERKAVLAEGSEIQLSLPPGSIIWVHFPCATAS